MRENKNIERLFQEKFKDFEVSPPDFIWENIQEQLNPKKQKRRVIPFWFKAAGIAASFVAIVSIVFFSNNNGDFNNPNSINNNAVVTSDSKKDNNNNQNIGKEKIKTSESNSDANKNQNNSNSTFINETESNSKSGSYVNHNATNSDSKTDSKFNKGSLQNSNTDNKSSNSFVSNRKNQTNQNQTNENNFKKNKTVNTASNSGIAINRNNKTKSNKNGLKSNSGIFDFNTSKNNNSNSGIANLNTDNKLNPSKNNDSNSGVANLNTDNKLNPSKNNDSNSGVANLNQDNKLNTSKNNEGGLVENGSGNSNPNSTAIVAVEEVKIDTIALTTITIQENPMEKLLREKETKKVVNEKEKWSKWAVNSFVSPIFFNSFTSGSPISEEFAANEKTFNNSTSYGVGVAYSLNKRLSIKTGVSNLNLDYDTENIAFYSSFEDQSRIANTNIERNSNGKYLVLKNEKEISRNEIESQFSQSSENLGTLNQRTQYIEVPVEMSYAILNKKFGVAIKGGMSTLFLTENVVSIDSNDGNIQIGKASNLNNVHFSSNLGLGFSYNFMKNFQLNLEPTLKYQINTFNKNSEDFTPYVIGVNTGISYKF